MRIRSWIRWLVLTALLVLMSSAAAAEGTFGLVHTTSKLNLRQQPSQSSGWLGSYTAGDWVQINGESGNWYLVTGPDGKVGYLSKNFVTVPTYSWGNVGVVTNPKSTSFLNLRQTPSYSAKVLDIYYNGVPCLLLSRSNGWYHVEVDGLDGYFRSEYVSQRYAPCSSEVATIVTPGNTGLNLRSGPGKGYSVLGQYRGGGYVMVLTQGNDWWRVSVDGRVGFMDADFLREGIIKPGSGTPPSDEPDLANAYAIVNNPLSTQVLNFRDAPSTTAGVLGQYRNGAKLAVLNQGTEWCRVVNDQGTAGYMMTKYLSLYNLPGTPTLRVTHPQKTFVYLRTLPSTVFGAVITRVPHGTVLTVLAPGDEWVKVSYNGQTGYMMAYFLQ